MEKRDVSYKMTDDIGTSCVATAEKLMISILLWSHQYGHATCDDTCEMQCFKKNTQKKQALART